ncbi:MAG: hypothetical protein KAQ90_04245 [Melioribacteraceae bacterium]|nr:hypothetical protein [Melioribacteraceae bacterium]
MKKLFSLSIVLLLTSILIFACSEKEEKVEMDMSKHEAPAEKVESELIRTGAIDVAAIDANEDEKVYECPMDWNVISDQEGNCPKCGMKLKEYSVDATKDNLKKYGYEVTKN